METAWSATTALNTLNRIAMSKITSTKLVQIVPVPGVRLFGEMVKKEAAIARANRGTLFRSGPKERDRARWAHTSYKGWINLVRSAGEVVTVEVRSRSEEGDDWQILHAFVGWVDRHFAGKVRAVHIHYQD